MKISIIIPVFNEAATVAQILQRVSDVDLSAEKELIVVNDGSTDGTRDAIEGFSGTLNRIHLPENKGKGAAVRAGLLASTGDIVVIQDADLEYDPQELPLLINPIRNGVADVVYGSRFMGGRPHRVLNYWHYVGNKFLTTLSNMMTNLNLTDMETGFKAFNRATADAIKHSLTANRFGIEPEITDRIARLHVRVYEIGISYYGRTYQEGKKINWRDGISAIVHIILYRFRK